MKAARAHAAAAAPRRRRRSRRGPRARRAVITPPPVPSLPPAAASAADSDEAWLAKTKGAATADEIAALEALRDRPLVARNEAFQLVVRAVRETTTVPRSWRARRGSSTASKAQGVRPSRTLPPRRRRRGWRGL